MQEQAGALQREGRVPGVLMAIAGLEGEVAAVRDAVRCIDALQGRAIARSAAAREPAGAPVPGLDAARDAARRRTAALWTAVDTAVRAADGQPDPVFRWLSLLVVRHAVTADPHAPDALSRLADPAVVCATVDALAVAIDRAAAGLGPDRLDVVLRFRGSVNALAQVQHELDRLQQEFDRLGVYRTHATSAVDRITERLTRPRRLPARWFYAVWRRGRDERKLGIVNRNLVGASQAFERGRLHQAALHATAGEAQTSIQACLAEETALSAFARVASTGALLAALES